MLEYGLLYKQGDIVADKLHINTSRIFALFGALLFLASTVAVSAVVVWQAKQEKSSDATTVTTPKYSLPTPYISADKAAELQTLDLHVGDGATVAATDKVEIFYQGSLAKDGTVFDSSYQRGEPSAFDLSQVIPGFQQGVVGMKEGGQRQIIIPAALGYGEQGAGTIGPNEDLVFIVEVVKIVN